MYRALDGPAAPRPRHRDGLARALTLYGHALLLVDRCEEACTALDEASAVPGARWSPARRASLPHFRAQAQFGLGRFDEARRRRGSA